MIAPGQAASMTLTLVLAQRRERILLPSDSYHNTLGLAARLRRRGAGPILVGLLGLAAIEELRSRPRARCAAETAPESLIRLPARIAQAVDRVADIDQSLEAAR